jgi:hypothetical protein
MNIPWTEIELKLYNVISCKGFETAESVGISFGPCAMAKMGFVLIFFINALVRKWGGEEAGLDYSFIGGLVGGLVSYFIIISFLGSFNIALIVGLIVMALGGYLGGSLFGGGEYE